MSSRFPSAFPCGSEDLILTSKRAYGSAPQVDWAENGVIVDDVSRLDYFQTS